MKFDRLKIWAVLALTSAPVYSTNADDNLVDITQISFEQLLKTPFIPASYIAKQISSAPSAVSVVTAQDIQDFGYKSLIDILSSMRGLYVTNARTYSYLGGRGFGKPGDYAGRIMLIIDGYVTNDSFFNQIFLGEDAILDVALIDRVEFIPGPGSTSYGNSAFLGVINITTKQGRDIDGVRVAVDVNNQHQRRKRISFGKQFDNGIELLLSASQYDDSGKYLYYSELDNFSPKSGEPFSNGPIGPISQQNDRLFLKANYQDWSLEITHANRKRSEPTFLSSYEPSDLALFDNQKDQNSYISIKHDTELTAQLKISSHLYYGQYLNPFSAPYHSYYKDPYYEALESWHYQENFKTRWWGADVKFVATWLNQHTFLFGAEYRNDYQLKSSYSDINLSYDESYSDMTNSRMETMSFYFQDEFIANEQISFVPGIRFDHNTLSGNNLSPRLAVIYKPTTHSTFKLSYGRAFRYANAWERFIASDSDNDPEQVTTIELVWQQVLTDQVHLIGSVYKNKVSDVIDYAHDELHTFGQELGLDLITSSGLRLKASLAHQVLENERNEWVVNSPRWVSKLNIAHPFFNNRFTAGFELQTLSNRLDYANQETGSDTVINLSLNSQALISNTDISLTVKNVLASKQTNVIVAKHMQRQIDDSRTVWLNMEYTFQ